MCMMGELNFVFGLQIKWSSEGIFISQSKYALEFIKKFEFENAKESKIPMSTTWKLNKDEEGTSVDQRLYGSMIGSLFYLMTSRFDIMLSISLCAKFQASTKESHLKMVKKIIKYVKHTTNFGLWYPTVVTLWTLCPYQLGLCCIKEL